MGGLEWVLGDISSPKELSSTGPGFPGNIIPGDIKRLVDVALT